MAFTNLKYGFYNYVEGDADPKIYDAVDVTSLFDGIITDGVYEKYKNHMLVRPSQNELEVIVGSGRAWFNHTWNYIDVDTPLSLADYPLTPPYVRIDAIVIDVNNNTRENHISIVPGTSATTNPQKPTLIRESGHMQYPIAYITRRGSDSIVAQDDIDTTCLGSSLCPFAKGLLEGDITTDELIASWDAQFNSWNLAQKESFAIWRAEREEEFDAWFEAIRGQLDGDIATKLQAEIDSFTLAYTGLASSTAVRRQVLQYTKNGTQYNVGDVAGSKFMEQWLEVPAGSSATATFTNGNIHHASSILVFTSIKDNDYDSMDIQEGSCSITYSNNSPSSFDFLVRIHILAEG